MKLRQDDGKGARRHRGCTLAAAMLVATVAGCGGDDTTPAVDPPVAAIPVEVATAELRTIPVSSRASGSVEPLRRVNPGTKILGRIEQVLVREGDRVDPGQLLARLESRDLEAARAQAAAALDRATAELANARVHDQRMADLHGRGSVTDKAREDAATGFEVAQAAVAQAEANLVAARVALSYAEVVSPISGWVAARHVEAGDMTAPGASLFIVEDSSRVKIEAHVPEAEVVGLAEGDVARVEILSHRMTATLDRIVPAGDPASRTFLVQILLDNPEGVFKSGMFARVSFEHGERQALLVPATAVVRRGQLEGLYVTSDDGGRARLRWVKTGRPVGDLEGEALVEILSGLEEGERVVVAPPSGLTDGATVKVI